MEYLSKMPERLKDLMSFHDDIKSDELGNKIGVSGGTVRSWVRGYFYISLANAIKLADFFHCSLDYLSGRKDNHEEVLPRELPDFYENIRKIMKEKGITRYKVTVKTSIKDSHFSNWSHGKIPKLASACILADYLNVTLDYLVGRRDF